MKPIVSFIAALFTVSLLTQCTPKASPEQPRSNVDIATEIVEEVFNAYPDSAWVHESCLSDILILKVGTTIGHQDNDTLKFLDLVTRINQKIEGIDSYRIFSDRQNDDKGISGRYVVSVRPDREGDETSTLFYKYNRSNCSCPHNQKDSISFVFTVNAGTNKRVIHDTKPGVRGLGERWKIENLESTESIKPMDDFFQAQYNDPRAIRHQATHVYPSATNYIWDAFLPNDAYYKDGDTLTTHLLYSQRPVADDTDYKEFKRIVDQYKHAHKYNVVEFRVGKTYGMVACYFMNENEILSLYSGILANGVFCVTKATAADKKGLCIESNWWR